MQATVEARQPGLVWLGPGELTPDQLVPRESVPLYPERWQFQPFTIGIYPEPTIENRRQGENVQRDPIVDLAINKFVARLTSPDLGNQLIQLREEHLDKRRWRAVRRLLDIVPDRIANLLEVSGLEKAIVRSTTKVHGEFGEMPRAVIRPGTGQLDLLLDSYDYLKMPDPKPLFFYVSAVDKLPDNAEDFDYSRRQLVRAAAHNGVIFEIDRNTGNITGFWWLSTQGNHRVVRGNESKMLGEAALRFCVHNGDTFVTDRTDYPQEGGEPIITWEQWKDNSIHHELHEMAVELHEMGLLDDHVEMAQYTPDAPRHGKRITHAINRSDLGEGMYSAKIGKVVAMSPSGGKKVNWSDTPGDHHLTPISHMTATGTVVYKPTGAPVGVDYANGSVEARENLDAYVMRQRYAMGIIDDLGGYEMWQREQLNHYQMIPVFQEGAAQEDFVIVHLHGMPIMDSVNAEKVEIVEPDYQLYPPVDMACGTRGGNGSLRSALARSNWFTAKHEEGKHFLEDRTIVVLLRGHGIVMLAKDPQAVLRAVKKDMVIKRPAEFTV